MPPPTLAVLDADFPDLANYSRFVAAGPSGPTGDVAHGAAVARVVANALDGSVLAGLTPDPVAISYASDELATSFASALAPDPADIVTASWGVGRAFADDFAAARYAPAGQAITDAVAEGRDGLGTILVFAAGNARNRGDNVNHHNFQNDPATIAVGALDADGQPADYATPGAALLLAARGSDVPLGDDPAAGEPVTVSGTSFAAPQVSAAVARMLDVNPALTSRDVQTILANTATPVAETASQDDPGHPAGPQAADPGPLRGITNGADNWNGGGRVFDNRTGFGALDADAATRLAAAWTPGATHDGAARVAAEATPAASIPDGGAALVVPLALEAGADVEQVTVDVDITHPWIGDLTVTLVSPSGTRSVLLNRPGKAPDGQGYGSSTDDVAFELTSNAFRGEASEGTWHLEVQDASNAFAGTLDAAALDVTGSAAGSDDTYVFTDAFADLAAGDGARAELADAGGDDHLLAAALSGDATIDLTPGATSVLAGRALTLLGTTAIEAATGGAGDDLIRGNALDNRLAGGPGADVLHGGPGDDTLDGGPGDDWFAGGAGSDVFVPGAGENTIADFDPWAGDRLALDGRADETDDGGYGNVAARPTDAGVLLSMDDGSSVHIEGIDTFDADWFIA